MTAMTELTPMQVRVLGALMEKKETTPEQYPLTLNALRNACNQKSARNPVVAYTEGQVGHTVRELEGLGLVREAWGARVAKYEHQAGRALGLQSKGLALMCALMLRGPQTLGELRTNTQRLYEFGDLDDVHYVLEMRTCSAASRTWRILQPRLRHPPPLSTTTFRPGLPRWKRRSPGCGRNSPRCAATESASASGDGFSAEPARLQGAHPR
jgi:hypothetical protein